MNKGKNIKKASLILLLTSSSLTQYKSVVDHKNRIFTLLENSERIREATTNDKLFLTFWMKFNTLDRIQKPDNPNRILSLASGDRTECKVLPVGAWVFFMIPYRIDTSNPGSYIYKLTRTPTFTSRIHHYQDCTQAKDAKCKCGGIPVWQLSDPIPATLVSTTGGGNQVISLETLNGVGTKGEIRNFMSSLMTVDLNDHERPSNFAVTELMKGQVESLTVIDFATLDYGIARDYLSQYDDDDQIYKSYRFGGVKVPINNEIHLKKRKIRAGSLAKNKLIRNFCFNFMVAGNAKKVPEKGFLLRPRIITGLENGKGEFEVLEEISFMITLSPNPNQPNSMDVRARAWIGRPTERIGKIDSLNLHPGKYMEISACYSTLWISNEEKFCSYSIKVSSWAFPPLSVPRKQYHLTELVWHGSKKNMDVDNYYRDFRFRVDSDMNEDLINYDVYFQSMVVMNGGMLETPQSSRVVAEEGNELGLIDNCLLELDSIDRKCLWSRLGYYYDKSTKKCEHCSSKISNCLYCRSATLCDSCQGYQDVFGSTSCLDSLKGCVAPKYSRFDENRCDRCDLKSPNNCRCAENFKQVQSPLGADLKMCVYK